MAGKWAGSARPIPSISCSAPGKAVRDIKAGIGAVLKWFARLLYLSPLFIGIRCAVAAATDVPTGDAVTVAYVCLVVAFFTLLNLYIVWAVIAHFRGRGRLELDVPFSDAGEDQTGIFASDVQPRGGSEIVRYRGIVRSIGEHLPGGNDLVTDLWVVDGENPWRMTEAMEFAIVTDDDRPIVIQLETAPIMIAPVETETVTSAVARMSPGITSVFDMGPALEGERGAERAKFLKLSEGQEVEIVGTLSGGIPNVSRFELGSRVCTLNVGGQQQYDPYRGTSGGEGIIVAATPQNPLFIRRIRSGLNAL